MTTTTAVPEARRSRLSPPFLADDMPARFAAWERFALWLMLGLVTYFLCGARYTRLRARS